MNLENVWLQQATAHTAQALMPGLTSMFPRTAHLDSRWHPYTYDFIFMEIPQGRGF